MKVALFGGSFNPVHIEHVNIVKSAIKSLSLDKVIVMPSNITPYKEGRIFTDAADRLNMCRLAFADIPQAVVSDYEIAQRGVSYSYLTCRKFKEEYEDAERYFIVGGDMLENFSKWKYPEEILKCVTLAVFAREDVETFNRAQNKFSARFGREIVAFDYIGRKVSSTKIRTLAAIDEDIEEYVGKSVANYIREHNLYKIEGLSEVKNYVSEKRWEHTIGVALFAAENCARYGISEEKAIIAATLHDCAKNLNFDSPELKGFVCPEGVPAPVVHQFAGAYMAEHLFKITDADILNAIRYHTTGRENMSDLEKLIFISDMLEEGRTFKGIKELRKAFAEDTEKGLYVVYEFVLNYIKCKNEPIYPLTEQGFEYLKRKN